MTKGLMMLAALCAVIPAHGIAQDFRTPLPAKLDKKLIKQFEQLGWLRYSQAAKQVTAMDEATVRTALRETLSDTTAIIYQRGHGVFIEYTGPKGEVMMWYPGNANVVRGYWGIQENCGRPQACYHYSNSINPVTGAFEPTECISPEQTLSRNVVLAERKGDVFKLGSGKLPYRKGALDIPLWP